MNKKNLKLIMELIFIFILPIAFMLISVKSEVVNTYDENGNLLTTEKIFDFSEDTILRDYNDNLEYKNTLHIKQLLYDSINYTNNYYINFNSNYNKYINVTNTISLEFGHKYYINVYGIFGVDNVGYFYFYPNGNNISHVRISDTNSSYQTIETINNVVSGYEFVIRTYADNNSYYNCTLYFQLIDLTEMFGQGFEPVNVNELNNYLDLNNLIDYSDDYDEKVIYSNDIISSDYVINYTWYSKLFNELYDDLQINNNIVLKLITTYIILWVIMFLVWHLLYRFVDFMVHLFDKRE